MQSIVKCNPNNSCVDCKNNGVNIKLTNKCNCNCEFCIEKGGLVTKEKSVQTLIDATNLLDYNNVLVLGGEPLLYPHLEEYLAGIQNKNIYLTTNGTLLTDEMAEMLSKYLTAINISIHHCTEEKNAEIYKYPNYSFDNIHSAIKVFKKNGIPVRINANLVKGVLDTKKDRHGEHPPCLPRKILHLLSQRGRLAFRLRRRPVRVLRDHHRHPVRQLQRRHAGQGTLRRNVPRQKGVRNELPFRRGGDRADHPQGERSDPGRQGLRNRLQGSRAVRLPHGAVVRAGIHEESGQQRQSFSPGGKDGRPSGHPRGGQGQRQRRLRAAS